MGIAHILYLLSGIFIIIMEFSDIHILTFITLRQIQHFVKSLSLFTQAKHTPSASTSAMLPASLHL